MSPTVVQIRELEPANCGRWDDFVENADAGTFYHLSGWQSLIEDVLRHKTHYLYCESDGDIVGVLPLARVRSWLFGDALISNPFLVYGGPVTSGKDAEAALLAAARDLASALRVDYLELRNRVAVDGDWLEKSNYVTFRKTLEPEPEANLMAVPRKQRAMIRKGIKAGLTAETDDDVGRLYETLLECKRNLGTPFFGRNWLAGIKQKFGEAANITTVTHRGQTVCSVMSFLFRDEVLPYYGGGGDLARELSGNDFMYWAVMKEACEKGLSVFDYGRSSIDSGAYRFKKHWGFEPEPLHYQYFLAGAGDLPNVSPSNPRYRFLVDSWRRLPLRLAGLIGPPLARRLA